MDELDPIEDRNLRLENLRTSDPVAWAICWGYRGLGTIAKFLDMTPDEVQTELNRLVKAKEVIKVKYLRGVSHRPHSQEMKRLARRAWAMKQETDRREYELEDE